MEWLLRLVSGVVGWPGCPRGGRARCALPRRRGAARWTDDDHHAVGDLGAASRLVVGLGLARVDSSPRRSRRRQEARRVDVLVLLVVKDGPLRLARRPRRPEALRPLSSIDLLSRALDVLPPQDPDLPRLEAAAARPGCGGPVPRAQPPRPLHVRGPVEHGEPLGRRERRAARGPRRGAQCRCVVRARRVLARVGRRGDGGAVDGWQRQGQGEGEERPCRGRKERRARALAVLARGSESAHRCVEQGQRGGCGAQRQREQGAQGHRTRARDALGTPQSASRSLSLSSFSLLSSLCASRRIRESSCARRDPRAHGEGRVGVRFAAARRGGGARVQPSPTARTSGFWTMGHSALSLFISSRESKPRGFRSRPFLLLRGRSTSQASSAPRRTAN